ncbi:MAG: DbpA RNA binding domain-containing protein [Treponema sp.]|nr:DbpA RNA binding domain-containing protein [Treponema sp.]
MAYNNYRNDFQLNEEKASEFLQNAVEKITTEEDIDTLTELIKIYKKNVPLTRRKYVIAYLLKEALKHYHSFGNNRHNNEKNRRRDERPAKTSSSKTTFTESTEKTAEERPRHPRVEIAPEDAASIFISIGKNRRVYPRDLVGILIAVGGIDRERIGDIKVLANYSFVQLYKEDAQTAIDKLNGYDYRGRKLAVSYSKQKDEDAGDSKEEDTNVNAIPADAPSFASDSISDEEMAAEDAAAYAAAEKAAADKEPFGNLQ